MVNAAKTISYFTFQGFADKDVSVSLQGCINGGLDK